MTEPTSIYTKLTIILLKLLRHPVSFKQEQLELIQQLWSSLDSEQLSRISKDY